MADSTLTAIRTKARRLTRSPSESQLTTTQLDEYINTFVLYDFPEQLRLFSLRTTLTFYTKAYVDEYATVDTPTTDPLYNFKNRYVTVHEPIYIAGYPAFFSQDRSQFFGIYPIVRNIASIGTAGDGVTTSFSGTLPNIPMLQRNVLFDSLDSNNNPLALIDTPISQNIGNLSIPNVVNPNTPLGLQDLTNFVNYVTGEFTLTFNTAPASGQAINVQNVPYVAALPQALLYFDNKFIVRPVPDQPYPVSMEVFIRPTEFLGDPAQKPDLEQWWQYIAYGTAKKIFEDRMDLESIQQIMPEFKQQERFILRRTIKQQTDTRTATIYTEQTGIGASNGFWGWSGGNF